MITKIKKKNEVYLTVETEAHIHKELSEYFTFEVPAAKFMPQVRNRLWDGKIRLYSPGTGEIYVGLYEHLLEWLDHQKYPYEIEHNKFYGYPNDEEEFVTPESIVGFVKGLGLPFKARDYQYKAIHDAIKYHRRLLLSPTGSGKSLIIYSLVRWHINLNRRVLIIVPTTSLVEQMYKDFEEYGWNAKAHCQKIYGGKEKYQQAEVTISTWQSIYKETKKWFEQFDVVIGDEAHLYKAKSLTGILTKLHNCKYRVGLTGSLDGSNTHKLVLEGLFGKCDKVTRTKDLQDKGQLSKLNISILLLRHDPHVFDSYQDEMEYIVTHEGRNKFIRNLCRDLEGNTLVLFNYVEKHGEPLYELINSSIGKDRRVFFVHGGVEAEEREQIRSITEKESNAVIIASYGTFSTGINIRNLHNVIFASPSKSRVRNLQSIGRVLRKGDNKAQAKLFDIADHISKGERQNYTLKHLFERINIYNEEDFDYEIIEVKLRR
jgi:superfamily II DNA or RNA helicase